MRTLTYPTAVADTSDMTRAEWLEARRQGIGGSDAGAILGLSKWASPYSLYLDKLGLSDEKPESEAMAFGNLMEPIIRERWEFLHDRLVVEDKTLYAHPERPYMLANLDGVVMDPNAPLEPLGILEIKTSRYRWDEVPAHYYAQVQHYLAVTGLPVAWLAALFQGLDLETFVIERDEAFIERMVQAEEEFWDALGREDAPAVDGSEATHEALKKAWTPTSGATVESPFLDALLAERTIHKAAVEAAERRVRELENQIFELLGDAEAGTVDGEVRVTWKQQSRTSIDAKALKEAHPEIAEQFTKTSTFRVLRERSAK